MYTLERSVHCTKRKYKPGCCASPRVRKSVNLVLGTIKALPGLLAISTIRSPFGFPSGKIVVITCGIGLYVTRKSSAEDESASPETVLEIFVNYFHNLDKRLWNRVREG